MMIAHNKVKALGLDDEYTAKIAVLSLLKVNSAIKEQHAAILRATGYPTRPFYATR